MREIHRVRYFAKEVQRFIGANFVRLLICDNSKEQKNGPRSEALRAEAC
ncbi:hypothetical protein CSC44_5647 [Pseudomonas aeruginosa]|nr:hypothetical protein CSC44_5647 [Pseudomonas aeruginosa]